MMLDNSDRIGGQIAALDARIEEAIGPFSDRRPNSLTSSGEHRCRRRAHRRAVIDLMARGHYDPTGWVDTIPLSGVIEQGFEELRAGRKMKLPVDPTA